MPKVREVMDRHVVAVSGSTSMRSAVRLMRTARVSVVPVLRGNRLIGLLQSSRMEEDIGLGSVAEIMLKPAFALEGDWLEVAARKMAKAGLPRLPVVNNIREMGCVGIVTSTEIARHIRNKG